MKVKLDENLGALAIAMFSDAQHDVATVPSQDLSGHPDQAIYDACRAEDRLLITLDLDFANPFRFDPRPTAGIAVIRVPTLPGLDDLRVGVSVLINELDEADVHGRLWIVERHRVRVYEPGA